MIKKCVHSMLCLVLINLLVCSAAFALEIPSNLTLNADLSAQAITVAQQQFAAIKQQLEAMLTMLPPDQQGAINQAIAVVEDKFNRLEKIEVYLADESTPGEAYDSVHDFYESQGLANWQDMSNDEVLFAVGQIPPGMVPPLTISSLTTLANQGAVKGVTATSGKSRLSLQTVYLNPGTMEVVHGTSLVVAIDK